MSEQTNFQWSKRWLRRSNSSRMKAIHCNHCRRSTGSTERGDPVFRPRADYGTRSSRDPFQQCNIDCEESASSAAVFAHRQLEQLGGFASIADISYYHSWAIVKFAERIGGRRTNFTEHEHLTGMDSETLSTRR